MLRDGWDGMDGISPDRSISRSPSGDNKDALVEVFSDEKWTKMTIREGVARGASKNIPPRKLLMVSRSLIDNGIQCEDGHFHCILNKTQYI